MNFKKTIIIISLLIAFAMLLISWGNTGHSHITLKAALSFNEEMQSFNDWIPYIADHSSDADDRKSWDSYEGSRHYIDIDNYPEFITNGAISQSLNEMIALHGQSVVFDNGVLPWATIHTYDSLVKYMRLKNWDKAKYYAADLAHYVADGHMPLHITRNYNGQYTGNTGIHSRYESTMINYRIDQIQYTGKPISPIADVDNYVFNYLYAHYQYVDSIMQADTYSQKITGSKTSIAYKDTLWAKTKSFTPILFKNASHALTELIYNAWLEAEKPSITGIFTYNTNFDHDAIKVNPNPFRSYTTISFQVFKETEVQLQIMDLSGKPIEVFENKRLTPDAYSINWTPKNLKTGIYLVEFRTPEIRQVKKLVFME